MFTPIYLGRRWIQHIFVLEWLPRFNWEKNEPTHSEERIFHVFFSGKKHQLLGYLCVKKGGWNWNKWKSYPTFVAWCSMKGFRVDGWIDHNFFLKKSLAANKGHPAGCFLSLGKMHVISSSTVDFEKKLSFLVLGLRCMSFFLCRFQKYHPQRDLKGLNNDGFVVSFNHFLVMFKRWVFIAKMFKSQLPGQLHSWFVSGGEGKVHFNADDLSSENDHNVCWLSMIFILYIDTEYICLYT